MDQQALNKKLAEWAFPDADTIQVDEEHIFIVFRDTFRKRFGNEAMYLFTNSLDACFKWLVPKLRGMDCSICLDILLESVLATIVYKAKMYDADAETPALALCLAIEKLIKEE